jgi:[ribosomal protein S5]-alanine N-acetyltransferase
MITTERLVLRPYVADDIAAIHAVLYGDAEAMRLIGGAVHIDETRRRIESYIALHEQTGTSFWAVVERATGAIVGEAGLLPFDGKGPEVELGYAFGVAYWGRGYATETGRALLAHAFAALGLDHVLAVTKPLNADSRHVLEKLGFVQHGRIEAWGDEQLYFVLHRPAATD